MADIIFEEDYDNDDEMSIMMMVMTMVNRNTFILSRGLCRALGQCRRAEKIDGAVK